MARLVAAGEKTTADGLHSSVPCLEWDDHTWTVKHDGHTTKEAPATQSASRETRNVAPVSDD